LKTSESEKVMFGLATSRCWCMGTFAHPAKSRQVEASNTCLNLLFSVFKEIPLSFGNEGHPPGRLAAALVGDYVGEPVRRELFLHGL
jgi:hypothetical protein